MKSKLFINIAIFLCIIILGLGNVFAQVDQLETSLPLSFYTNTVEKKIYNSSTEEYDEIYKKEAGNLICFNIPKSVKNYEIYDYINNYYYKDKKRSLFDMLIPFGTGKDMVKSTERYPIKYLRLYNYRNTQNSLELNSSEIFWGEAELESGQKCKIANNLIDYRTSEDEFYYVIMIFCDDTLVKYRYEFVLSR